MGGNKEMEGEGKGRGDEVVKTIKIKFTLGSCLLLLSKQIHHKY